MGIYLVTALIVDQMYSICIVDLFHVLKSRVDFLQPNWLPTFLTAVYGKIITCNAMSLYFFTECPSACTCAIRLKVLTVVQHSSFLVG